MLKKFLIFNFYIIIFVFIICSFYRVDTEIVTTNYKDFVTPTNNAYNNIVSNIHKTDLLAHLTIPKIKVDEDIYKIDSSYNNVNEHVTILKESVLPSDNKDSVVFLAAHSGSGHLAYFRNLNKLQDGDVVSFSYNNIIYTYRVVNVFEEEKDGDIEVSRSSNRQLVLTTCSPNNDDKQLIVDTILINEKRVG